MDTWIDLTIMPPADAHGFCKEICRLWRPKSGAANAKTKRVLAFTIYTSFTYNRGSLLRVTIFYSHIGKKNNKLPMSVDRHLEECYIKYRQKHIIIANVRE